MDFVKTIGDGDEVDVASSGEDSDMELQPGIALGLDSGDEREAPRVTADSDDHHSDASSDDDQDSDAGAGAGADSSSDSSSDDGGDSGSEDDSGSSDDGAGGASAKGKKAAAKPAAPVAAAAPTTRTKVLTAGRRARAGAGAKAAEPLAPLSKVVDLNQTFKALHLSRPLLKAVADMNYSTPTSIQWKAIPVALAGNDVCGSAQTGSGKTAAFLLPALERLLYRDKRAPATRVLVVLPTRELATQCFNVCKALTKYTDIRSALAVGGLSQKVQEAELRTRPDVVIGTPGRLVDHAHNSAAVHFDSVDILVLDEADRLLEMGFTEEVQELVKACPVERQTLFFSATMTSKVEELAKFTLKKPERVSANPLFDVADLLSQEFVRVRTVKENEREAMLLALLLGPFQKEVIVFFERKVQAHRMMILLSLMGLRAGELHGNLTQQQRLDAFAEFSVRNTDILVATDLAGRGLDIDCVKTVINFEMPRDLTTYVHRVGRTARAGRKGHAVTLTGEHRRALMKEIVKHAQGSVKSRTIDPVEIEKCHKQLRALQPDYLERVKAERLEKAARLAEMEATRASNMIEHAREIGARPPRTWFQTETQKQELKAASKAAVDATERDLSSMSAKERKAYRNAQRKQEKKVAKAAAEKSTHRLNRAKRRRRELLEGMEHTLVTQKAAARFAKKHGTAGKKKPKAR